MDNITEGEIMKQFKIFALIRQFLRPYYWHNIIAFIVSVYWACDLVMRPYVLKKIIDQVAESNAETLWPNILTWVSFYCIMMFLMHTMFRLEDYVIDIRFIPHLRQRITQYVTERMFNQDYIYYQKYTFGNLSHKLTDLTTSIPDVVHLFWNHLARRILMLIFGVAILAQVHGVFALFLASWSAFFLTISFFCMRKIRDCSKIWAEHRSVVTGRVVDVLSNILSVKLFTRQKNEHQNVMLSADDARRSEEKLHWRSFILWIIYGYSFVLMQIANFYILIQGRLSGWVTPGDFAFVLGLNFSIVGYVSDLAGDFMKIAEHWGKITQAFFALNQKPQINDVVDARPIQLSRGEITFDNVDFAYDTQSCLFQNFSLHIPGGQRVGLVGYSGGGKTTFVNLILRLFDVQKGKIYIDHQNIRNVTQHSLHESIAVVAQDSGILNMSIFDNIAYGMHDATFPCVEKAAKQAAIHEFIQTLPQRYQTKIGSQGIKLSGGQKQRIAIARALVKNANMLIFDEATAQLDTITESYVQKAFDYAMSSKKTTIVIAHRLSTLLCMDRLLVFDAGQIVEDGCHDELLKKRGIYYQLWTMHANGIIPHAPDILQK